MPVALGAVTDPWTIETKRGEGGAALTVGGCRHEQREPGVEPLGLAGREYDGELIRGIVCHDRRL